MIRKKGFKISIVILFVILSSIFAQDLNKVFKTPDNQLSISTPDDWDVLPLNDAADIQVGNVQKEQYLILISEEKLDMYGWNLKKHSYVTFGSLTAGLDDPKIKGPFEIEINRNPAIQYEIEGSTQGIRIVYLHTTVETDSAFNQLLSWTIRSKYSENKKILQDVVNTFRQSE